MRRLANRIEWVSGMTSVTSILKRIESGSESARDRLLHRVYGELRAIANNRFSHERNENLLQPTALVHEAFLRLFRQPNSEVTWDNSSHFFGAASNAMRQVLIESARQRKSAKRGGSWCRVSDEPDQLACVEMAEEVLALDESLSRLESVEPQIANLVKLRFFVGLTVKEAAIELGIGARTADDYWAYAKAWLRSDMQDCSEEQETMSS